MKSFICAAAVLLLQAPFAQAAGPGRAKAKHPTANAAVLREAHLAVTAALTRIESALAQAAPKTAADPSGTVESLCATLPAASCAVLDARGRITAIAPKENAGLVGADVSQQDHAAKLLKKRKPVMGDVFVALQGYPSVGIYRPLFSDQKEFAGGVGVLVKPEVLLKGALAPWEGRDGRHFWVMDTYGRVLYDSDETQVGKMLFSDPLYSPHKKLLALSRRIAAQAKGKGEYRFLRAGGTEVVAKSALWDTVGLHGARWRLVLVQER